MYYLEARKMKMNKTPKDKIISHITKVIGLLFEKKEFV